MASIVFNRKIVRRVFDNTSVKEGGLFPVGSMKKGTVNRVTRRLELALEEETVIPICESRGDNELLMNGLPKQPKLFTAAAARKYPL